MSHVTFIYKVLWVLLPFTILYACTELTKRKDAELQRITRAQREKEYELAETKELYESMHVSH